MTTPGEPDRSGRRHRRPPGLSHRHTPTRHADPVSGQPADTNGPNNGPGGGSGAAAAPRRPEQLSAAARRRLQAARLWIAANRPYYSKALFACGVIPTVGSARVGIDDRWQIYASSERLESLTVEQAAAELIHALNHALRGHSQRARNTGVNAATAALWNAAADCEINDDLHEDGLIDDEDDGWLFPESFAMDEFLTAERYWRHLVDNAVTVEVTIDCGSGCHSHHTNYELADDTASLADFDRKLLRRAVASAIADHRHTHGTGSVPEGLARWAQGLLRPKVDWRQTLAAALRTSVHHKTGAADYTWQRPSRRQQPQDPVLRPALTRPVPSVTVVVDTSGSMSSDDLDRAITEIGAIIATVVPGDSVRVLSVDTDIHTDHHIHNTNQIALEGGGGTDMAAGICAAAETSPDAIVVITDGLTPWPPTRPTGARHVIAALTGDCDPHQIPDWIQVIDMSDHPAV